MSLIVKETKNDFEKAAPGIYQVYLFSIVDMGYQTTTWNNVQGSKHKVKLTFEICNTQMQKGELAGQPLSISQNYTMSFHPKSLLRKDVEGGLGQRLTDAQTAEFDLFSLLGRRFTMNIIHSEDGQYANVGALMGPMMDTIVPPMQNPIRKFAIGESTQAEFEALPEWLRRKINMEVAASTADEDAQTPVQPQEVYRQTPSPQAGSNDQYQEYQNQLKEGADLPNDSIPF